MTKFLGIQVGKKKTTSRKSTKGKTASRKSSKKMTKKERSAAAKKRMAKLKRYPSGHKKAGQIMPKRYQ